MRIGAAAVAIFALTLTGAPTAVVAGEGPPSPVGDGWQRLDAGDTGSSAASDARDGSDAAGAPFDAGVPLSSAALQVKADPASPTVTQSGIRPAQVRVASGHGKHVPLGHMFRALLPRGFTVDYGDVPSTRPVTWQGGSPWDVVLSNALSSLGDVSADIDWEQHHVTLAHIDASTKSASTATPRPDLAGSSPGSFVLVAGESLGVQLSDWAKRAGWSVTWNTSDDWIVPHDKSYGVDFAQAITQVITDMQANGADVQGDVWKGNSSVVIDKRGAD